MERWRISVVQVSEFDFNISEFEDYMTNVPTASFWIERDTNVQCMMGEKIKADRYGYKPAVPRVYSKYFVDVSNGKIINLTCCEDEDTLWCETPAHEHKVLMAKFGLKNIPIQIP
jgi:hypothetical protein